MTTNPESPLDPVEPDAVFHEQSTVLPAGTVLTGDGVALVPAQTAFPWRATARTVAQTWLPLLLAALVVVPQILDAILAGPLPDEVRVWLVAVATGVAAVSATVARIMAIPAVDAWLRHLGLSSMPAGGAR